MTDVEMDRLMCRVLTDAIALDAERTGDADIVFQSSRRHKEQMRRMLKNPLHWEKNRSRTPLQNVGKWTAVILLFVSLSIGIVMLFSAPARAAVERWIVEWYETHIVYRYSGSAESLPRYELTGLPKGFTELERMEELTFTSVVYGNETDERICFDYEVVTQGGAIIFASNEDVVVEVMIGKNQGMLFLPQEPDSLKTLTWIAEKDSVQFTIVADMNESDLIELAENVQKKKKE